MQESTAVSSNSSTGTSRRLYRSRSDRMLAGVCSGLGNYFSIDTTLIRLVWVFMVLFAGTGVLFYLILWIIVPEEPVA